MKNLTREQIGEALVAFETQYGKCDEKYPEDDWLIKTGVFCFGWAGGVTAEREACAVVAVSALLTAAEKSLRREPESEEEIYRLAYYRGKQVMAHEIAAAIRARGEGDDGPRD